jgi:hypothetical protein
LNAGGFPHEFSGSQRQRIAIVRTLVTRRHDAGGAARGMLRRFIS